MSKHSTNWQNQQHEATAERRPLHIGNQLSKGESGEVGYPDYSFDRKLYGNDSSEIVNYLASASQEQIKRATLGLQQTHGNQYVQRLMSQPQVMRQRRRRQPPADDFNQQVFVVRDPGIGLGGGTLVPDLAAFKRRVMRLHNQGEWSLVLAIHGSEERLGAQQPPNWQENAIFYNADTINQLFSQDPEWVAWRDAFGPGHLALVACQVSVGFERTLIDNFTRQAERRQGAQGLGEGCKPISEARAWDTSDGHPLRTRRQYLRLPAEERRQILEEIQDLNRRVGYYGSPPVPDDQVLDYFFNEEPTATWVIVEIGREQQEGELQNTHIPFWNRATGEQAARFHRFCDQGVIRQRERRVRVPPEL